MRFLSTTNLCFDYGAKPVLSDICLDFDSDDFIAIIGPNGGGKSTLLRLMLGLLEPKSGRISRNIAIKDMGYVPQVFRANENFNARVIDVVLMAFVGERGVFYTREQRQKALEALQMVQMDGYANSQINNLSGGQKQRVFIARALASDAKCLLLDEPTASIDIKGQAEIFELLRVLHERHGKGIVVVCHDAYMVLAYADLIAYINTTAHIHRNDKQAKSLELTRHLEKDLRHLCQFDLLNSLL